MLYIVVWLLSILISFLLFRFVAYYAIENLSELIISIICLFIPFYNIVFVLIVFANNSIYLKKYNNRIKEVVRKIFFIKNE